ncbi:BLUF domain-containing protein [Microbacterium luteum]|jgi:hypothetical protein|uniref:BLUF domain-containing protein n=1 Tax=Microbacterium TaxID=33882 RepID=UPI0008DA623D|nr:BLUF domain-containing protein [Microbacterium luteum]
MTPPEATPSTPDSDQLISLVYISTATAPLDDAALHGILTRARENNARLDVTGMLLYREGQFVQILEGASGAVHDLADEIRADPRHTDMSVILDEPIEAREFSDWSMGFQPMSTPRTALPDGFRDTFADLDASAESTRIMRAVREISLWFRVRSASGADEAA